MAASLPARSSVGDPRGPASGTFKVTRGGSHSTEVYYLRSANRAAQLPTERTWLTGFRLVSTPKAADRSDATRTASTQMKQQRRRRRGSDGVGKRGERLLVAAEEPSSPAEPAGPRRWNRNRSQPLFLGPAQYVNIANNSFGPLWTKHNHDPALAVVPGSGDVVAVWFTTYTEPGREAALAMATLPAGAKTWGAVSSLYDPPDRCMCCPGLFANETSGELLLFSQQSPQASYGNGIVLRHVSSDGGKSWKVAPVVSMDFYSLRHQPVETVIALADGTLVLPSDNGKSPAGTALHFSEDGGRHFTDPGKAHRIPRMLRATSIFCEQQGKTQT